MNSMIAVLTALLTLAVVTGTSRADTVPTETKPAAVPQPAAAAAKSVDAKNPSTESKPNETAPAKPVPRADALAGKVLEISKGGGYTFFFVEKDGEKFWVATPPTEGKVGQEMSFQPGIEMRNFKSKSLDRTFDQIYFSGGKAQVAGGTANEDFLMQKAHSMRPSAEQAGEAAAGAKQAAAPELLTGKVVEKLDGGGYSFFLIEKDGKKTWVAVPPTEGKKGEVISFRPGIEMKEFKSKALDRTFDSIIFSDGTVTGDAKLDAQQIMKMAHEGRKSDTSKVSGAPGKALDVKVAKAAAPNGYTVAELYEKSGELNGKPVVIAGKVVKVSRQIMGKNWVHLQDGSGDTATGTNNLVTTTQDVVEVGDMVTATGKLAKDKDFGGGYFYTVIIEETTLVKK